MELKQNKIFKTIVWVMYWYYDYQEVSDIETLDIDDAINVLRTTTIFNKKPIVDYCVILDMVLESLSWQKINFKETEIEELFHWFWIDIAPNYRDK